MVGTNDEFLQRKSNQNLQYRQEITGRAICIVYIHGGLKVGTQSQRRRDTLDDSRIHATKELSGT